ncbi:hypothetical protein AC1031_020386 [Aphanomyces cochlioides]|nr:hypothetical protein AC1031_020386 [Aphanomyces cochlioides]
MATFDLLDNETLYVLAALLRPPNTIPKDNPTHRRVVHHCSNHNPLALSNPACEEDNPIQLNLQSSCRAFHQEIIFQFASTMTKPCPTKQAAYDREYCQRNKAKVLQRQKLYREQHKEHFKSWYQQNKAKVLARVKEYHQQNKERRTVYERERRRRLKAIKVLQDIKNPTPCAQMNLQFILN